MEKRRFKIVRAERGGRHQVKYDEITPTYEWDELGLSSKADARNELYQAMDQLVSYLVAVQGWPVAHEEEITILALIYQRDKYGSLQGVKIEAERRFEAMPPWTFRSVLIPWKVVIADHAGLDVAIEQIEEMSLRYVNGMRTQGDLFDEKEGDDTKLTIGFDDGSEVETTTGALRRKTHELSTAR